MYASGENFLTQTITLDPLPELQEIDDHQFIDELKSITIQMWHNFITEHVNLLNPFHFLSIIWIDFMEIAWFDSHHDRRETYWRMRKNAKRKTA